MKECQGLSFSWQNAILTGRVRLDMAAMLEISQLYRTFGPTYRYIGVDASPQPPGLAVLVTAERVITWADVLGGPAIGDSQPPISDRRLPISVLGHGRCSLADQVMAHVLQTCPEYWPSLASTRMANADVRQSSPTWAQRSG